MSSIALGRGVAVFGVEGTGSYGSGLARFLRRHGRKVLEVSRPPRKGERRLSGKSDSIDAEHAAREVLAGRAKATPKLADGIVEAIRLVKIARDSAVGAHSQAMITLKATLVTAPDELRGQLEPLTDFKLIGACAALDTTGDIAGETAKPTPLSTGPSSCACDGTHRPSPTSNAAPPKASPRRTSSAASSATSPARSTACSPSRAHQPTSRPPRRRLTSIGASTRWPRASTGSTNGSSSTPRARGPGSKTSSGPPSPTSTGSTTGDSTARSPTDPATPPPRPSKPPTTVRPPRPPRPGLNSHSLYETRGGSRWRRE